MGKAKIVIADDDLDIRDSVTCILEAQGYEVIAAKDRTEAMEKIRAEKPNLAVLDVMMDSTSDGFEMSRELKKDPEFKDMPILLLTGIKQETGFDFESDAGDPAWRPVDGFLNKPVEPETLISEVSKLLQNSN